MEFNTQAFESTLLTESRDLFKKIIHEHPNIYVIGFYHTGGWDSVWPIFNTQDQIAQLNFTTDDQDELSHHCNLKWNPIDYPGIEDYASTLPKSEQALQTLREHFSVTSSTENLQINWQKTLSAMESVLRQLIQENTFTLTPTAIVYLANHDESFEDRLASIMRINSPEKVNSIKAEFDRIIKLQHQWQDEAFLEVMRDDDA